MENTKTALILTVAIFAAAGTALILKRPPSNPIPHEQTSVTTPSRAPSDIPDDMIDTYLKERVADKTYGGTLFCAHEEMGRDDSSGRTYRIFIWAYCTEYYRIGRDIRSGSALSVPISLTILRSGGNESISAYKIPGNGSFYAPDVKKLFPENLQNLILPSDSEDYINRVDRLARTVEGKRDSYFKMH